MATRIGTIIDEKYEVLKEIGKGGMSIVYLAMDRRLNKQWAVKEVKKTGNGKNDEVVINSLIAETNLMKRLDHPSLPRIVDIIDNGETLYIVMDYVEGESLDKILKEYGSQPQDLVVDWAMQICDALSYLHSQNPPIIYRDMKPANVMLKPEGNIKIIDFGIAREYKEKNLADTTILGTKGYAPPEQYGQRQTDARSDIYALGMTMHHLLTGIDPRGNDYEYHPVRQWNPEVHEGIEYIIDKCTSLDPDDRYNNCNELLYDLNNYKHIGAEYRNIQKKKLKMFTIAAAATVCFAVIGGLSLLLMHFENSRNYEERINIAESTPYETKVETYLEAIDIYGTDVRAYMKLLDAFEKNGSFGDKESSQFTTKYNQNQQDFDKDSDEYKNLAYKIGSTYLYLYSGGDDSFRTRILKAAPYFKSIVESGDKENEYYKVAQSYDMIGDFYSQYVVNATSVKEPDAEDYENLLEAINTCIENVEGYESDDSNYIKLVMYRELANLINNHRKGFAATGVSMSAVEDTLNTIKAGAQEIFVTQQASVAIQEEVINSCTEYIENVERTYDNTEERRSVHDTDI